MNKEKNTSRKQVIIGSLVISFILAFIIGISLPLISQGEIDSKISFIISLITFLILFLVFIPVIKKSTKMYSENVEKVEIIKGIVEKIIASKSHDEIVSLQMDLAESILDLRATADISFLSKDILAAFDENVLVHVNKDISLPDSKIRNEYIAKAFLRLSPPRTGTKEQWIALGRAAYNYGGYSFMNQVLDLVGKGLDFNSIDYLQHPYIEAWNEIENWKDNR